MNLPRFRRHRWLVAVLAFALAFAQVAIAAHACPIADATAMPGTGAHGIPPMPDCDAMPAPADPAANLCEAHCFAGQQAQSDNGDVLVPLAVLPPLVVRMLPALHDGRSTLVDVDTPLPTPPPLLRFTRLLI